MCPKADQRVDILGVKFSALSLREVVTIITNNNYTKSNYICFPSTNTISKASKYPEFQNILNSSFLTLCDGKFTEFYGRMLKFHNIEQISGLDLMNKLLRSDLTHYFYGLKDCDLKVFKEAILKKHPNSNILGFKAPPFVELHEIKSNKIIIKDFKAINKAKPNIVWIGISTIKQDFLMKYHVNSLDNSIMIGVGAVFLYQAGIINPGPQWIKNLGMRWL